MLQPVEDEAERNHGRLSAETHARIHDAVLESGLGANNIPKEFGGGGFNLTEQIVTHEQLGRLTNCLWVLVWSPSNVLVHGTPEQVERYLLPDVRGEHRHAYAITEGDAGSDPRAIEAEAVWNGDTTSSPARSGSSPTATSPRTSSCSRGRSTATSACPTLFLVDKDAPGVEMTADPDYTHNFPYRHPEFTFTKTPVPRENILGEPGRGFELTGEWFIEERVHIAARCVGACDRLIELGTDWALHREQFGGRIFDHQAVSFALADCAAEVTAARLLTYYVGWLADTGADRKLVHHKAAMAKLVASETAGRVADRVVQIFGGRGYMRENPAERLWRELRVDRIWEGTSEIQRLIIARGLERRGPATLLDARVGGLRLRGEPKLGARVVVLVEPVVSQLGVDAVERALEIAGLPHRGEDRAHGAVGDEAADEHHAARLHLGARLAQAGCELQHLRRHLPQRRAVKRHGARIVGRGDLDEALERVGQLAAAADVDELGRAAADVRPADVTEPGEQDVVQDLRAVEVQDPAGDDRAEAADQRDGGHRLCHPRLDARGRRTCRRAPAAANASSEIATVRAVFRRSLTTDRAWMKSAGLMAAVLVVHRSRWAGP